MLKKQGFLTARNIALLGVLTAIVVLLQTTLATIKIGATSFSLVLIPIVIGSCVISPIAGGFLGFVFSLIVFLYGVTGADPFTFVMFSANPFATVLIIFSKGILAGAVPGVLYNAIKGKSEKGGIIVAALSAPVVNTGIFILLVLIFGKSFAAAFVKESFIDNASALVYFLFVGAAGINFIVEFFINLIATPVFYSVIGIVGKKLSSKKQSVSEDKGAE